MTEEENNLLTKIILGTPTEHDFLSVSDEYDVVARFITSHNTYNLLTDFGIFYGERISNKYLELYISYKNKTSYTDPNFIIAVIYEEESKSYWVRLNTKGLV